MNVAQSDELSRRIAGSGLISPNSHPELAVDTPLDKLTKYVQGLFKGKKPSMPAPVQKAPAPIMSRAAEDSLSKRYLGK